MAGVLLSSPNSSQIILPCSLKLSLKKANLTAWLFRMKLMDHVSLYSICTYNPNGCTSNTNSQDTGVF